MNIEKNNIISQLEKISDNKEKLRFLIDKQPSNYKLFLTQPKYGLRFLLDWIDAAVPLLKDAIYELKTKVYWILNDIKDFPKCIVDGKPLIGINVYSVQQGYKKIVCSKKCLNRLAHQQRTKKLIEKFGVSNNFARKDVKEKISKTNINRYGNACPANNKKIREKIESKNMQLYGTKSYSSTKECRDKVKLACFEKYGTDNPVKNIEVQRKIRQTNLKKYGVEYVFQNTDIKNKAKQTLINRYGENYKQVVFGKNGNVGQSKRAYNDYILKNDLVQPLFSEEDYIKARLNKENNFKFKCKKCGNIFESYWDNGGTKTCPYCQITNTKTSRKEQELYVFILNTLNTLNRLQVKHNCRDVLDNYELDIYVPEKKFAIEFDGLYWHNDDNQHNKNYHLQKTELCEKHGIHLIHVFENEWNYMQDIVKSRLKDILGIYAKTVFARKCIIKEVDNETSMLFQEKNHLQGAINSKVSLGLYYSDELVSLMTFGKCRFDKKHEWEMLRFCSKLGQHVVGAAGKLLKHFENTYQPKSLVSYADRRWSQGKLYEALKFKLINTTSQNYFYLDKQYNFRLSRLQFQKHKLKDKLKTFDENKTEVQNMLSNGYDVIFDCGNLVFEKTY